VVVVNSADERDSALWGFYYIYIIPTDSSFYIHLTVLFVIVSSLVPAGELESERQNINVTTAR